jgi:hypothetical protein
LDCYALALSTLLAVLAATALAVIAKGMAWPQEIIIAVSCYQAETSIARDTTPVGKQPTTQEGMLLA